MFATHLLMLVGALIQITVPGDLSEGRDKRHTCSFRFEGLAEYFKLTRERYSFIRVCLQSLGSTSAYAEKKKVV